LSISGNVSGGEPLIHAAAADKRLEYSYIFEFICGYGEHIAVDHNKVSEFSGFEGSLAVFFKTGVGSVTRVQCERLFDRAVSPEHRIQRPR
jgi:hypothetical protein